MQNGVHTTGVNRLAKVVVCKLPLLPVSQIADLPTRPPPPVAGCQPAAVFGVPCIKSEKPSAADKAFLGGVAYTKALKQVGAEHPHKGNMVILRKRWLPAFAQKANGSYGHGASLIGYGILPEIQ